MLDDRRQFLKGAGLGLLALNVGGTAMLLTPTEARSKGLSYQILNQSEVSLLEALGEVLVSGSAEAGIAHFVDYQLANSIRETKLAVRYLGLDSGYAEFYQQGLAALAKAASYSLGQPFVRSAENEKILLVQRLIRNDISDWEGPPAAQLYFAVKSDGVDVVYGTQQGIEHLGVPYMPHIIPPTDWGEDNR